MLSFDEIVTLPLVYSVPGTENVLELKDIPYRKTNGSDLKLDLYLPSRQQEPAPAIIFIHGGLPDDVRLKPKDWVLLAGIAACSFVWFAVGSALRGLLA